MNKLLRWITLSIVAIGISSPFALQADTWFYNSKGEGYHSNWTFNAQTIRGVKCWHCMFQHLKDDKSKAGKLFLDGKESRDKTILDTLKHSPLETGKNI